MKDPLNSAATVSNETFSSLFETMDQGVVYQDAAGVIVRANPAAERILGLTCDQIMGRSSLDPRWKLIRADGSNLPGDEHPSMIALRTGRPVAKSIMGVYHPVSNELRWILVSSVPDRIRDGVPQQIITTFTDITDLKKTEERLQQTEKHFHNLFDTMREGFAFHEVICNAAGEVTDYRYLDLNQAFEQLTGLKRETTVGRTVREVLPEIEEEWIQCFGRVALTGIPDERESHVRELDRYYRARAYSPEKGKFAVVFEETTTERRAQRELERREALYNDLVETATDLVWRCDTEGRYTFLNRAWESAFGYSLDEMLGHRFTEFMSAEQAERDGTLFAQLLASSGRIRDHETVHLGKDGTPVHLVFNATFYHDEAGEVIGTQGTAHNITDRKKSEIELSASKEFLTSILENIPNMIFVKDANELRFVRFNRAGEELLGMPREELIGRNDYDFFPKEEADFFTARDREVLETGNVLDIPEETIKTKHGQKILHTRKIAIRSDSGAPLYLAGISEDITERKANEKRLAHSHELMRYVIEHTRSAVAVHDRELRYIYVSQRYLDDYKVREQNVIGKHHYEVFPDLPQKWRDVHQRALAGEVVSAEDDPYCRDDGTVEWTRWECRPWYANDGSIGGIIVYTEVTTDRKNAEEERLRLERQLLHAQKLESLGVLAGGIAHDFNNILTAIIGNADLALMRLNKESPALDNLRKIEQAAARAADLAKQMLAYSGKGKFVVEAIDLNRLIEEMFHMLEVSISKKAVLKLNPYHPLPSVEADATQIRQIIMNLVINASEAIGDRSGIIAVTTGVMSCDRNYLKDVWLNDNISEGLYVYLEIADTGCGMDKETLAKLFDPFFTTKFTGRGLGMAAVLGIVRGHKGAIKVYSEPNRGTTFKILLPASERPAELFNSTGQTDHWQGSGTVLLVDDEETVRGIGSEMLNVLGFEVITADDGREALETYRNNPGISLVILDLTMPHMDGEQCFRELRQLDPKVKVIMSSGFSEQEVTQKFAGKGLAGFIQKPYKLNMLKEVIRRAFQ